MISNQENSLQEKTEISFTGYIKSGTAKAISAAMRGSLVYATIIFAALLINEKTQ